VNDTDLQRYAAASMSVSICFYQVSKSQKLHCLLHCWFYTLLIEGVFVSRRRNSSSPLSCLPSVGDKCASSESFNISDAGLSAVPDYFRSQKFFILLGWEYRVTCEMWACLFLISTLILLMWSIGWAPNNASKWQMWFNLTFKGLT
jgi:hypothetical protein